VISISRKSDQICSLPEKFKGDKAYIGEEQIDTPHKNRKISNLSKNKENKEFSANRVFGEHVIRLIKLFRVAQERFRLNREIYEQVILTVCGLARLRIGALVLSV